MKNQEQKEYEAPQTTCLEIELEQGFMNGSIGDQPGDSAGGLSIENQTPGIAIGGGSAEDGWSNPKDYNLWDDEIK